MITYKIPLYCRIVDINVDHVLRSSTSSHELMFVFYNSTVNKDYCIFYHNACLATNNLATFCRRSRMMRRTSFFLFVENIVVPICVGNPRNIKNPHETFRVVNPPNPNRSHNVHNVHATTLRPTYEPCWKKKATIWILNEPNQCWQTIWERVKRRPLRRLPSLARLHICEVM